MGAGKVRRGPPAAPQPWAEVVRGIELPATPLGTRGLTLDVETSFAQAKQGTSPTNRLGTSMNTIPCSGTRNGAASSSARSGLGAWVRGPAGKAHSSHRGGRTLAPRRGGSRYRPALAVRPAVAG